MKKSLGRLALAVGVAATFAVMDVPVQAGSTTITDASGVDFDAGCVANLNPTGAPPAPNSYKSPGGTGCNNEQISTYDGSAESVDMRTVTLGSSGGQLVGSVTVDGPVPAPGSTSRSQSAFDLPDGNFVGGSWRIMFQNIDKETNGDNPSGGCVRVGTGGRVRDQRGHWKDGYHFFLSYDVAWDGTRWIHSAAIGEYDPSPDGAFFFTELGTNNGSGWTNAISTMAGKWSASKTGTGPTTMTLNVNGIVELPETLRCAGGVFKREYASDNPGAYSAATHTGDQISNVKALATADQVVTLPVTVPLSALCGLPTGDLVCEDDITSVGGFLFFVDTTPGSSKPGRLNTNTKKIAYGGGATGFTDNLGDGPNCPWTTSLTLSGVIPDNPLWLANQNKPCQIDDENIPQVTGQPWKATFFAEWFPSLYSFTF